VSLSEQELREFLTRNNVDCRSLKLLWEIDNTKVYGLTVSGSEAINKWNYLRQLTEESNYYPLLLGADEEIKRHQEAWESYVIRNDEIIDIDAVSAILERASKLNAENWFCDTAQELYEDQYEDEELEEGSPLEIITNEILGDWDDDDIFPSEEFSIPYCGMPGGQPLESVEIALIPTQICWHVPAYLNFGGWNSCPIPEEHVCLMKRWHNLYGAEVVGITHDVVEMRVTNPPLNRHEALFLAQEQYLYCNDIVDQCTQTLSILVATLVEGSVWYFWWD
jgi:hypothetical protein